MRRLGLLALLVLIFIVTGCAGNDKPSSPVSPSGKEAAPAPFSSQRAAYENGKITPSQTPPPKEPPPASAGDESLQNDGAVFKSETPVSDPEAERALQSVEKELDEVLEAIRNCENVQDEDLVFPGVEQ